MRNLGSNIGECRRLGAPPRGVLQALLLAAVALVALVSAPSASADLSFCPSGEGAGQCAVPQHINSSRGLAFDSETGHLYVADNENNRIDVFEEDGSFLFAFGWKVNATSPEEKLQTCTTATGCQKGSPGAGSGQFNNPGSVAVDNDPASASRHDLYVGEGANLRVQKFEPSGEFVWTVGKGVDKTEGTNLCTKASGHTCGAGAEGEAEGTFASQSFVATGPGGALYVLDSVHVPGPGEVSKLRLQRFQASGTPIPSQAILFEGSAEIGGIAVDAAGDAWISGAVAARGLSEYSPSGALLAGPIDTALEFRGVSLTIAPSGDIYAGQSQGRDKEIGSFNVISAYDSAGNLLRRFAYLPNSDFGGVNGLAAHSGPFGAIAISEAESGFPTRIRYVPLPPPGPIAVAATVEAPQAGIGSTKATLLAEVNPEGKATEVHFDYLSQKAFEEQGNSFEGPATKSTPTVPLGAEGFSLKAAEATIGCPDPATEASEPGNDCLAPETEYRYRVVATNEDGGGEGTAEGEPFTTAEPLEFGATYASEVGTDTARLNAEVNPFGVSASGYFEYVTDAQFQESGFADAAKAPDVDHGASPLDFGSGEAPVARSLALSSLQPATTYRYRILATNPLRGEPVTGPVGSLTTLTVPAPQSCPENQASRTGPAAYLPDCRAYELVSPLEKGGGDIRALKANLGAPAVLEQSATSGGRLAYGSYRAFGDAPSGAFTSQYVAERIPGREWVSHAISPPRGAPFVGILGQSDTEIGALSPDLCQAWVNTVAEPPLGPGAVAGYSNLYRRSDRLCGQEEYEALAPIQPPAQSGSQFGTELQGISADGSSTIFRSSSPLAPGGSDGVVQLYEWAGGPLPLFVCWAPDGAPLAGSCEAGSGVPSPRRQNLGDAFSADGSRVYFSSPAGGTQAQLYVRQNPAAAESARAHGAASGTGTLVGPASATGAVLAHKHEIKSVASPDFVPGQQITDAAGRIPAATVVLAREETSPGVFTLTISQETTGTTLGDLLTGHPSQTVFHALAQTGQFAPGQEISAPGIAPESTVEAVHLEAEEAGQSYYEVTISSLPVESAAAAPLQATSPCTEAALKACTVAIPDASEAFFWGASNDGDTALFTTGDFEGGAATLYAFSLADEASHPIAGRVLRVMGISEDARRIYLVSKEALAAGASEGEPNLYLYEAGPGGGFSFIATLTAADLSQGLYSSPVAPEPLLRSSRVSADGAYAAFTSYARLTPYDNDAALGGEPAQELYLYDTAAGKLICTSCNPSGARPATIGHTSGGPIAASIPPSETSLYASRPLSADGRRLFFETGDALVARDTNGAIDVYEWEAPGAGSCLASSAAYSSQDQGCIYLISSGQSPVGSRFVEADPSGSNVFIATLSSLLPQDYGLLDIYDARIDGGLPTPRLTPAACEGESCQSPPAPPDDPTPASSSYEGAGNLREAPPGTHKHHKHGRKHHQRRRKHHPKRARAGR